MAVDGSSRVEHMRGHRAPLVCFADDVPVLRPVADGAARFCSLRAAAAPRRRRAPRGHGAVRATWSASRRCPRRSTPSRSRTWSTAASSAWRPTSPRSAGGSTRSSATPSSRCSAPRRPRGRRRAGGAGRAAHAGDARATLRRAEARRPAVRMRIGVNTGEVLVGALRAGGDYTAMGDVVNTASRLQTSAAPGQVLVGPATYAATRGVIRYEPLGLLAAKGREEPVEAWVAVEALAAARATGPAGPTCRSSGATPSWRCSARGRRARSRTPRPARARASARPAWARPGWPRRSADWAARASTARSCSRAGACPTARPTCGGRSPRRCVRPASARARGARRPRPARAPSTRSPQVFRLPADEPEVVRVTNGLLYLIGYEGSLRAVDPTSAREEAAQAVVSFIEASTAPPAGRHPAVRPALGRPAGRSS